ncbi:MAG: thrombospondin type 3 repeat-containing protein, partial [Chthoniobacterales bacterium]
DGDGLTNAQEFLAGTDPTSGASALRITSITNDGTTVGLSFPTVFSKSYQLEYKNNITDPSWNSLGTSVAGTGGTVEVTDTSSNPGHRYYRLRLL